MNGTTVTVIYPPVRTFQQATDRETGSVAIAQRGPELAAWPCLADARCAEIASIPNATAARSR